MGASFTGEALDLSPQNPPLWRESGMTLTYTVKNTKEKKVVQVLLNHRSQATKKSNPDFWA
jgi:hypothetical protein